MSIRIRLSERQNAGAMPQTRTFQPTYNEALGRTTGALGRQIVGDAIHSMNVINQVKERDAQIAATEWETGALRLLNGTTVKDQSGAETHVPGMAQKSWQDYEKEGKNRSPLTDIADYEKEFQNSETYKNMDGLTRKKFNRMVEARRARLQAQAGELYDRNARKREAFYDEQADRNGDEKLMTNVADATHEQFNAMNREVAKDKVDRRFRRMDMSRPEVQAAYNEALLATTKAQAAKRIETLAMMGAQGEVLFQANQVTSSRDMIDMAGEYLEAIKTKLNPAEASALAYKIIQARKQLEGRVVGAIKAGVNDIALRIDDKAGMQIAEKAIEQLPEVAKAPTGLTASRSWYDSPEVANLVRAETARLDKLCDEKVKQQILDDLIAGKNLTMNDGEHTIFPEGSRQARLYPQVKAAFDAKVEKEARKEFRANHAGYVAAARQYMLLFASGAEIIGEDGKPVKLAPAGYSRWLAKEVMRKNLAVDDYMKLSAEYKNGWLNGYRGQEEQMPKQVQLAGEMLKIVKDEFGADFAPSLQRLDSGELKLSKHGRVQIDKKGEELPEVKYERDAGGWWNDTEKFTGEEMVEIINEALGLSLHDGMEMTIGGQKHTVDALDDFRTFIHGLKDEKQAKAKAQELADRAAFVQNIRLAAEANRNDDIRKMDRSGVYASGGTLPGVEDFLDEE